MSGVLLAAAALTGLLGVLCGGALLLRTRDPRLAVRVLLELLLAAGLLGVTADEGWRALLVAALLVGLRGLVGVRPDPSPTRC